MLKMKLSDESIDAIIYLASVGYPIDAEEMGQIEDATSEGINLLYTLGDLGVDLSDLGRLGSVDKDIAKRAAYYLGEINAIHPFREGNGRTQREFIRQLLLPLNYYVDYSKVKPDMMLYASINAFAGDYQLMTQLFENCIIKQ